MLFVLSPAKRLDFERSFSEPLSALPVTTPELFQETRLLSQTVKELSAAELKKLMSLSDSLARLNVERFQSFDAESGRPFGSRPAALAFDGDTYAGLRARDFSAEEMRFAQERLVILSGFYGLLRPLDAISPYRLEMGTRIKTPRGSTLYEFWGDRVAKKVDARLKKLGSSVLVNLASEEYFSVLSRGKLKAHVVTPVFKELRGGKAKVVSFSAKRARGAMARFLVEERLTEPDGMKKFRADGYKFQARGSTATEWLFLRDQPEK